MTAVATAGRWLRDAVFENVALKVLSLMFAVGFYLYINGAQNAQRSFAVSVLVLLPRETQNRVLLTQPPASVRLTLHGGRTILDELKAEDIGTVQLDLRRGTESFGNFDTSTLNLPPGVRADIEPPGLPLVWDDIITRSIPIQTAVTGQPAPGYAVQEQPVAEPSVVTAQGPKSLLETLQNTRAEPFDVGGLVEGIYRRQLSIGRSPSSRVTFDVDSTSVTVEISRARLERLIVDRPIHVVGLPRATTVPAAIDVKVMGPPELVSVLRAEQVVPTVDLRSLPMNLREPGSMTAPVSVALEGCTVQLIPATVVVKW